ncbi:MAG TPA: aspartate-semialdehyde dehydrogenase [Conexivisphaerales archaeon]|nr:aspartate-semialdehyde dehydrogenase [Conexivisphaerales archaeon]
MSGKIKVGLLGATGVVGQRYVQMLESHPSFELAVLMGKSSAGKEYEGSVKWLLPTPIPERISKERVKVAEPASAADCKLVFSALPSEAALGLEPSFAERGIAVVSEVSAHRMEPDVPLLVPEVNADHLRLLEVQRRNRRWGRGLVTTPNCTVTGLAMVLRALAERFPVSKAVVTTMQAVSGAGYPGVSAMLILENVIPYIKDEEEKMERESEKILGTLDGSDIRPFGLPMAVSCNRVSTLDGHLETLYCEFDENIVPSEVESQLEGFVGEPQRLGLHTAPKRPIIVTREEDRPQPRLDRLAGTVPGMSVVVGRVRRGLDDRSIRLTLLSHNTIRGAAGNALLTAELMNEKGYL